MHNEMVMHFGPDRAWLLELLKDCACCKQIPTLWRKVKVVALLNPIQDGRALWPPYHLFVHNI